MLVDNEDRAERGGSKGGKPGGPPAAGLPAGLDMILVVIEKNVLMK